MDEIIREIPTLNENAIENDGVVSPEGSPERIDLMTRAEQAIRLDQATPGAASID